MPFGISAFLHAAFTAHDAMLTPRGRRPGEVGAVAGTVDDPVHCRALTLAGDSGMAIREEFDIPPQHNLHGLVDPAMTLWQGSFGVHGHLVHGGSEGLS